MVYNNFELWRVFVGLSLLWLLPFSIIVVDFIIKYYKKERNKK